MDILDYCNIDGSSLTFGKAQASHFAKAVAGDFNPLHNEDARRFCVPGDLLFALMLTRYGVANSTIVEFEGMVNDDTQLTLPDHITHDFTLADAKNREYLKITYATPPVLNSDFSQALVNAYVQFSGQTFPDILVELMREENVMINPDRPLVIYKRMSVELSRHDATDLSLEFDGAELISEGKKGEARLNFKLKSGGDEIGRGQKVMLLGGLRAYDQSAIDGIVAIYNEAKLAYVK